MPQIQPEEFSATLLRRVAHAVDGFRSGHLVYVVVDTERPYKVRKMVRQKNGGDAPDPDTLRKLERLCEEGGATYKWTGPYQTFRGLDDPWTIECHEFDSDPCDNGDVTGATINPPSSPLPKPTDVEELTISWKTRDGELDGRKVFRWEELCRPEELDPDNPEYNEDLVPHMVDALFFTQAASDKFLIPYIARVHGVRAAFEYRSRMDQAVKDAFKEREAQGLSRVPRNLRKVNKQDRDLGRAVMVDRKGKILSGSQDDIDDWEASA